MHFDEGEVALDDLVVEDDQDFSDDEEDFDEDKVTLDDPSQSKDWANADVANPIKTSSFSIGIEEL